MEFESEIRNISLEGFQLVKCKYFSRMSEPVMSLFPTAISFSVAAHEALNGCESVEILVNELKKSILVKPSLSAKDSEAVKWRKGKDKPKYSRIECSIFTKKLYSSWKLDNNLSYKSMGKIVQCDKKVMLLFEFSDAEVWEGSKLVKENGQI